MAGTDKYAFDLGCAATAAQHWTERTGERARKTRAAAEKRYVESDSRPRLAAWANRQISEVKARLPALVAPPAELRDLMHRPLIRAEDVEDVLIERVIGATRDFLAVAFLDRAVQAARCVGRIETDLGDGRHAFGTGFLVSPRLLLTNHHVLEVPSQAAASVVEFDYQLDYMDQALTIHRFGLDPDGFFLTDKELDFALVAVKPTSANGRPLTDYGWTPLFREEGKIRIGEAINIVQHPRGEMKQIVIRGNKLLDLLEDSPVAHYEADTEPGSSGSPVFNDRWEVVALHHSGVPRTDPNTHDLLDKDGNPWHKGDDPARLDWVANEGIRVSRLMDFIANAAVAPKEQALRAELLASREKMPARIEARSEPRHILAPTTEVDALARRDAARGVASLTFDLPVEVTIRIGTPIAARTASPPEARAEIGMLEAITPDPDYASRPGFDGGFLGFSAPLPELTDTTLGEALAIGGGTTELKYYHYSVIMNSPRRLAFVSAVNYDPEAPIQFGRDGGDRWFIDPRILPDRQAGAAYYANNPLDRGHLTRRLDAAWGSDEDEAKLANDDTFHFTNCSPQHEIFNQSGLASHEGRLLWGNIENHITAQSEKGKRRLSIYNGPVFRSNDRRYTPKVAGNRPPPEPLKLPRQFWKIVAFKNDAGEPAAVAFVLSQSDLIKDLPATEEFVVGPFEPYQVSVRRIEELTHLDFGSLKDFDAFDDGAHEAFVEGATGVLPLASLAQIVL